MVKIEKVEFNAEETKVIEKFFDILSRLEEIEFTNSSIEDDIFNLSKNNSEFFFNNENVVTLTFSED